MKKTNYIAIITAGISVISVFLPWIAASSSASVMGQSASFSSGGISGININGGLFGLLVAIGGGFLAFKRIKWAFIAGIVNFFNGLGYLLGWFGFGMNVNYSVSYKFAKASAKASVDPQVGLYLFTISSLVFTFMTLIKLKKENVSESMDDVLMFVLAGLFAFCLLYALNDIFIIGH